MQLKTITFNFLIKILSFFNKDFSKEKFKFNVNYLLISLKIYFYRFFFIKKKISTILRLSKTDKYKLYSEIYDLIFSLIKKKKINLLEIGIGGHNKEFFGGSSLIAFSHYFNKSKIFGADLIDKSFLNRRNIKTFILDQSDAKKLNQAGKKFGNFDIIIDDGSHFSDHQRLSFENLFKYLNTDGLYIIEDMYGSYEKALNGDPELKIEKNNFSFFSQLVHAVNSEVLYKKKYDKFSQYIDIDKIFFFPRMIVIQKKIKNHKIISKKYLNISLEKYSNRKNSSGLIDYSIPKKQKKIPTYE